LATTYLLVTIINNSLITTAMSKTTKLLLIIIILQTLAIVSLIYTIIVIRIFSNETLKNNLSNYIQEEQDESNEIAEEKVNLSTNIAATIVWWDQDNGFESIKNYSKYIDSVSPFWYELNMNEEISPFSGAEDTEIKSYFELNNIKILPIISNEFEREPLASIIADTEKKQKHINDILVIANQYDGVSLNYENLNEEDKDNYSQFIIELANSLHENNKLLGIHLHAKNEEPGTWNGPKAQDWETLGGVCDKMKIMAYDYHWSTSEAGAIAPPDWVEEVIQHARELIPNEKIYLGIPLYGYDWISEEGEGITYEEAVNISELNNVQIEIDSSTNSPFFTYTDNEDNFHEVWFENSQSTSSKLNIVQEYEIGGIDFYRLGGEDKKMWGEVEKQFTLE